MKYAITRDSSPRIAECELTHLERVPIDFERASWQHAAYCDRLSQCGYTMICLPAQADAPDSVFVEDIAIVTDDVAVITNPGAPSRRGEVQSIAEVLQHFRPIEYLQSPATLDGGDVLVLNRDVYVGMTARTNERGIETLRAILDPRGYTIRAVSPRGCLHLKSAVTRAGADSLVLNPNWIDPSPFADWNIIEVDPGEPVAANVLWLGHVTLVAGAFPRTREKLEANGIKCKTVDMSELAKAEGALTCCSILFVTRVPDFAG